MDNGEQKNTIDTRASFNEAFIFISVLDIIAVIYMMVLHDVFGLFPDVLRALVSIGGDSLDTLIIVGVSLYGLWMILSIPRCVIAIILTTKRKRPPYSLVLALIALFLDAYWIALPTLLRQPY